MKQLNSCNLRLLGVFLLKLTIFSNNSYVSHSQDVKMYQVEKGNRTIGASVVVKADVSNATSYASIIMYAVSPTPNNTVGSIYYENWSTSTSTKIIRNENYYNLNLSISQLNKTTSTRTVTWYFSKLLETDDKLLLYTSLKFSDLPPMQDNVMLIVQPCPPLIEVKIVEQQSTIEIRSNSTAQYGDTEKCNCTNGGILFRSNGTRSDAVATCQSNASWTGCSGLQCWLGPQDITVEQMNYTVGESNAFNCSFLPGFPEYSEYHLKIGYRIITPDYALKSSDNGKNASCQVITNYTTAMDEKATSRNVEITVYYPPENSSVSDNYIVMLVNESKVVNFLFNANPVPGSGEISVNFSGKTLPSYQWGKNSSEGTLYNYELIINWTSDADYGDYDVCAASSNPGGENCTTLTISKMPATTMVTTYTTPLFSDTTIESTDKEQNKEQNIGIIVGAAVGGVVALLLIIAVVHFVRRKRGKNSSNKKEERINEIYESTPNPGPSTETVYTVAGNSQAEMKTNEMYEASPQQPEIQDVYTTVNRDNKLKGKKEKDSSENPGTDSTSAEENGPAVADVYAMVKK